MTFHFKKHYFDGIDSEGNAFILYYAQLKFWGLSIPYSSSIISTESNLTENSKLNKSHINSDNSLFENEGLECKLKYEKTTKFQSINEILWNEKNKWVKWQVSVPHSPFTFYTGKEKWKGLGYAETIELNFVPWKLPISTLKWGRFLSENFSVIWIEWIGEFPLQKVYVNGVFIEQRIEIKDSEILIPSEQIKINFHNPKAIKNEKIEKIANLYPFLKLIFNKKFLESKEMKFKSKSSIKIMDRLEEGYSLYETVQWKS